MTHAGYVLKFLIRKHKQSQTWWTLCSIFEWETLRNESSRYSSHSCHWKNDTETISITAEKACFSFQIWIYRLLWCKKYPSRNAWLLWNKKNCWFRQNIFLIIFWLIRWRKHKTTESTIYSENRMVHIIPGCPGSTAEFWGAKYWKCIKGKSIELDKNSSNFRISQIAPQYFYDYCYVYEWIDKYG